MVTEEETEAVRKLKEIGEDETGEIKFLTDYMGRRLRKRLACNIIFTGELGKGKSYAGLRLLELWYKRWFEEEFPTTHICNDLISAMTLVKKFNRKGEGVLIEELSVLIGSRDSLSKQNKLWNKFMDIVRIKQAILVGNLPFISFVDKHMITLTQVWIETLGVNFRNKICICKPLILQPASFKKDPYKHRFLNDDGDEIRLTIFKRPSEELCKFYDNFKIKSVDETIDEMIEGMMIDKKKNEVKTLKIDIKEQAQALLNRLGSVKLVAKALNISESAVYKRLEKLERELEQN